MKSLKKSLFSMFVKRDVSRNQRIRRLSMGRKVAKFCLKSVCRRLYQTSGKTVTCIWVMLTGGIWWRHALFSLYLLPGVLWRSMPCRSILFANSTFACMQFRKQGNNNQQALGSW